MMFTKAIVKKPCRALIHGITDHPELGAPDYEHALAQHAAYVETLRGASVLVDADAIARIRPKRMPAATNQGLIFPASG